MAGIKERINKVTSSIELSKQNLAAAISSKGVPTSSTDTFQVMRDNILNIPQVTLNQTEFYFEAYLTPYAGYSGSTSGGYSLPSTKIAWFENGVWNLRETELSTGWYNNNLLLSESAEARGSSDSSPHINGSVGIIQNIPEGLIFEVVFYRHIGRAVPEIRKNDLPDPIKLSSESSKSDRYYSTIVPRDSISNIATAYLLYYFLMKAIYLDDGAKMLTTNEYGIQTTRFIKEPTVLAENDSIN